MCDQQVAAQAAAEQVTARKMAELKDGDGHASRPALCCEGAVNHSDAKLTALGWGGKAAPNALQVPGQPRILEAPRQGEGWVFMDWKEPADGGAVVAYKIERRERPVGDWMLISMTFESETTLNQERGKDWEYRVIASNKAGEGMPSNTVAAVL